MPDSVLPSLSGSARFKTTRWTMVLGAGERTKSAEDEFCRTYWYPIYSFIRRQGKSPDEAQDLTQGVFEKLFDRGLLTSIERRSTRFSTWLHSVVLSHVRNEHRDENTIKRGGGQRPVSMTVAEAEGWFGAEPATTETPATQFERRWALAVLDAALRALQEDMEATGGREEFEILSPFLSRVPENGEYALVAKKLGILEKGVAVRVFRLRQRYRDTLRAELARGHSDPAKVDEELQHLKAVLASAPSL